jgi:hypothetical protein
MKEIWFDMDGTIADLYGVENWLSMLIAEDTTPYEIARPLLRMATLARVLNGLRRKGYTINIISWTSKSGSIEYNQAVAAAKKAWLRKHLASVEFNRVDIVDYGTPKGEGREGILFDDEERNRAEWNGIAYNVTDILGVLKAL